MLSTTLPQGQGDTVRIPNPLGCAGCPSDSSDEHAAMDRQEGELDQPWYLLVLLRSRIENAVCEVSKFGEI